MNMNQFTQKSLAAIQGAQDLAVEYGQQQIEQQHLLLALVADQEGFIPQLLTAMGTTKWCWKRRRNRRKKRRDCLRKQWKAQ